jgi:hypothetical protein
MEPNPILSIEDRCEAAAFTDDSVGLNQAMPGMGSGTGAG